MADAESVGGMFIMLVVFLGTFFFLVSSMPPELLYSGVEYSYSSYEPPTYFNYADITENAYFLNGTLTSGNTLSFDYIGWGASLPRYTVGWGVLVGINQVQIKTFAFWPISYPCEYQGRIDEVTYTNLNAAALEANFDPDEDVSRFYAVGSGITPTNIYIADSNSARNNMTLAFADGSVEYGMGLGLDALIAGQSVWDIVGQFLSFRSPDIHPAINFLIAMPIWVATAYVIYVLIKEIIPFL